MQTSVIEGVFLPKVVSSGTGYQALVDIGNVDYVAHSSNQAGIGVFPNTYATITNPNITPTSVVLLTPIWPAGATIPAPIGTLYATCYAGYCNVQSTSSTDYIIPTSFSWFIARY